VEAVKSIFRREKRRIPRFLQETEPDQELWVKMLREKQAHK